VVIVITIILYYIWCMQGDSEISLDLAMDFRYILYVHIYFLIQCLYRLL
jgi:hypothetical protein